MSAAPKPFEVRFEGGVPLIYAVDEPTRRAGLAGEALARAAAVLDAVRSLRTGSLGAPEPTSDALVTAVLIDRALELVRAGAAMLAGTPDFPSLHVAGDEWEDVIFGRTDWLSARRLPSGDLVPDDGREDES